ncbi:DinB family protein [SAR202 cluster bacterium AC-647-N09_OGT_505m]|nr:DinB family protein [SAR202 cluster bacterium AC-647-N09_OGT_505m]
MSLELEAYIAHFKSLHDQLAEIIRGMPNDELNWIPIAEQTNSAAVLVTHMLGAESFRIHQLAGVMDINRDRDSEFLVNSSSVSELESFLDNIGTRTEDILNRLSSEDLDQTRPAVRSYEGERTVRWHILHTIEHFGIHIGHLTLTRQLYAAGYPHITG